MSTFTIDPDNNITALVEVPADADRSTTFSTAPIVSRTSLYNVGCVENSVDDYTKFRAPGSPRAVPGFLS
jgi:hypothetical protein